jgi:hypothetical protein
VAITGSVHDIALVCPDATDSTFVFRLLIRSSPLSYLCELQWLFNGLRCVKIICNKRDRAGSGGDVLQSTTENHTTVADKTSKELVSKISYPSHNSNKIPSE